MTVTGYLLIAAGFLAAVTVGLALALGTWNSVRLTHQVDRLQQKVCAYQLATRQLVDALAAAGFRASLNGVIPPEPCP
jgi:hypothetical protein